MKKLLSLILALTLCLGAVMSITSCGNGGDEVEVDTEKQHYVVGICQLITHDALDSATQGFKDALTAELAKAGRTVEFDYQNAAGSSNTCSTIVNTLIAKDVDLILANATAALQSAANATLSIPILGTSITEYGVALGIDNFEGTVGGNISGTSDLAPLETQAQMMIDTLGLTAGAKVGILYCSSEPNSQYQAQVVRNYLTSNGIDCGSSNYTFTDTKDLQLVTERAANECDAIYVPTDNTVASNTGIIDGVCASKKIPIFAGEEATCKGCGYATLSIDYYNIGKKTGEMAAEILLGKKNISEMAIAYDENPVRKYNEAACINLGIDIEALKAAGYTVIPGTEAAE